MKKLVTAVVVIALALLVGPWAIGRLAESRVDKQIDQFVEAVPMLGVVERKYTPGWFSSQEDVTFEVLGPWAAAMHAAAPGEPAPKPPRFTVHNDILHGPLLGLAGLGIARVDSRVELAADIKRALVKSIGTDDPVQVSTKIGFFGSRKTTFSSDERTVTLPGGAEVYWDDLDLSVSYTSNLDSIDYRGDWPRIEVKNAATREHLVVDKITLDGTSERLGGDLYDTDVDLKIDSIANTASAGDTSKVEDARYEVKTSLDGDFVSYSMRMGAGPITGRQFAMLGGDVQELHYDFTLRRLHEKTLEQLATAIKESYTRVPPPGVSAEIAMYGPIKDKALELLGHDPELIIDRIGLSTADGDAYLKGVLRFKGVSEKDLDAGALGILGKIDADLNFEAPQKLLEKAEGGAGWVNSMVQSGYLERKGDKVVSHIEFRNGELKVNGKAQGIPGVGGPPAGAPEVTPPQG